MKKKRWSMLKLTKMPNTEKDGKPDMIIKSSSEKNFSKAITWALGMISVFGARWSQFCHNVFAYGRQPSFLSLAFISVNMEVTKTQGEAISHRKLTARLFCAREVVDQCTEVRRTSKAISADKTKTILEKKILLGTWRWARLRNYFFLFFFLGVWWWWWLFCL